MYGGLITVREKRVGILKPQGSLERAREERAMATTQEEPDAVCQDTDGGEDSGKSDDKKEVRKPRVNIAMAAIMRKQEETNKQVKFVTPPPTPDSTTDVTDKEQDKPKVIQPKPIKGLVALPLGRKTGGILSLKDKSAGYPHLVNAEPELPKKTEKEEKKEIKPNQATTQSYQPKRQENPPSPNWSPNAQPNVYNESVRMSFQKNYGAPNAGVYAPNYPQPNNASGQGIRLPVVNPKEIDVRTAAMQKQTSRTDLFQEGPKFAAHGYQMSGDKKNFLNDLPPRFANQYRYWQAAHDSQLADNKFRDDSFKTESPFDRSNWRAPRQPQDGTQQQSPWKPESDFNSNFSQPVNLQANFYSPHMSSNVANPYRNLSPFNPMQNTVNHPPADVLNLQGYVHSAIGQPQLQTLQNIVSSPNFSSSLNNFGTYAPTVGYDSSMYPQFGGKMNYPPMQMKMMDKPRPPGYPVANGGLMDMTGLGFGSNVMDVQQRNLNMNFNDPLGRDVGAMKNLDSNSAEAGGGGGEVSNTYSLFSGAAPAHGPHLAQQSLWSGPGPSPLERLLEQQKQMKPQ
ncbi:unnamed protein product [Diatraea saccharalis]|uniref:Uncharacterized protein n=1 Tax=Diatraea saccharalis TaxID=40085 RepID=A0A9N9QU23_9NEOP|nr:unnamed protein product [Diatraea saccharalis]